MMILESQMTALRSQMNPLFIFNSINSIQNYILKENTQQAYDYLAKFSKLIRMVLANSKETCLPWSRNYRPYSSTNNKKYSFIVEDLYDIKKMPAGTKITITTQS
jgi:hypothetical protein